MSLPLQPRTFDQQVPQTWSVVVSHRAVMWSWSLTSTLHCDISLSSRRSVVVCCLRSRSVRWVRCLPRPRCEGFCRRRSDARQLAASCPAVSRSGRSQSLPSRRVTRWQPQWSAWTWRRCVDCEIRCETVICRATSSWSVAAAAAADKRHSVCCTRRQVLRHRRHSPLRCCPMWCRVPICNNVRECKNKDPIASQRSQMLRGSESDCLLGQLNGILEIQNQV